MKITFLGTGNAQALECYNTCFVISEGGRYFLVDGGGGNTLLRQLRCADINWADIRTIFVTHKHIDHIMGIVWMVRMICRGMSSGTYKGDAEIFGHEEVLHALRDIVCVLLTEKELSFLDFRLHLVPLRDGEVKQIIEKPVTFFDIQSTKIRQFGFSMSLGEGRKLTCCGDEPYRECELPYARGSTWLLHEAFCVDSQRATFQPFEKHHTTVKLACEAAEALAVKNLVLYHTEDTDLAFRKEKYRAEGARYFSGNLYIPNDLEQIEL